MGTLLGEHVTRLLKRRRRKLLGRLTKRALLVGHIVVHEKLPRRQMLFAIGTLGSPLLHHQDIAASLCCCASGDALEDDFELSDGDASGSGSGSDGEDDDDESGDDASPAAGLQVSMCPPSCVNCAGMCTGPAVCLHCCLMRQHCDTC